MQGSVLLASKSPRRRKLLAQILNDFRIQESNVDESVRHSNDPQSIAEELAFRKAVSIAARNPGSPVLAADTVIDLDGEILCKPADSMDAFKILTRLSGRVHVVITGLALVNCERGRETVSSVLTEVEMRRYGAQEIWDYIETEEPLDKAGAYGIQGRGGSLVRAANGCFNNVIGLPLCEVSFRLESLGLPLNPGVPCRLPSGHPCPRLSVLR